MTLSLLNAKAWLCFPTKTSKAFLCLCAIAFSFNLSHGENLVYELYDSKPHYEKRVKSGPSIAPASSGDFNPSIFQELIFLSITMVEEKGSHISWRYKGNEWSAFSNVDFEDLRSLTKVSSSDDEIAYTLIMSIGRSSNENNEIIFPETIQSSYPAVGDQVAYSANETIPDDALEVIDEIHQYYAANYADLKKQRASREEKAKQKAQSEETEAPKKDHVIKIWPGEGTIIK